MRGGGPGRRAVSELVVRVVVELSPETLQVVRELLAAKAPPPLPPLRGGEEQERTAEELLGDREWLYQEFIAKNRTQMDIAGELGVGVIKLQAALTRLGIRKRAPRGAAEKAPAAEGRRRQGRAWPEDLLDEDPTGGEDL